MNGTSLRFVVIAVAWAVPAVSAEAPLVVSADIRVVVTSLTSCEVTMALRVDGAIEVEHRVESFDGAVVVLGEVLGARLIAGPQTIGRTQSVVLRLDRADYQFSYRSEQAASRGNRCPIWLPTIPTAGQLGTVRLAIRLPGDTQPSASMPPLSWSGPVGTTTLGHVPAFVRVAYRARGTPPAWDLSRVMDGLAVMVFVGASLGWLWRRRRATWG